MEERWEWVVYNGHDMTGCYMVSDKGRVRSVERYTRFGQLVKDKILKQRDTSGRGNTTYKEVTLSDNGKVFDVEVHRLVATAFVEKPEGAQCVNHKDGNGSNNDASNLEWCTFKDNVRHSIESIGNDPRKWKSKPVKQIDLDGNLVKVWPSAWEAQRQLNISQVGISRAARRVKKSGIFNGYRWDFANE